MLFQVLMVYTLDLHDKVHPKNFFIWLFLLSSLQTRWHEPGVQKKCFKESIKVLTLDSLIFSEDGVVASLYPWPGKGVIKLQYLLKFVAKMKPEISIVVANSRQYLKLIWRILGSNCEETFCSQAPTFDSSFNFVLLNVPLQNIPRY